jgi:tRNA G18 (ribose-2'-O)-methylase SpoU
MDNAARCGVEVLIAEQEVMAEVTGFNVHRGVLAIGQRRALRSVAEILARKGIVLAAEGCNDGENMGALGRAAAAFGAVGFVLDPTCCDPLSRRAVRVSLGHILAMPLARAEEWPDAIFESGAEVVALTPHPDAVALAAYVAMPGRVSATTVLVVGAEGPGLSAQVLGRATTQVRIPMSAGVDSLNVATAAAVALSHLTSPSASP